MEDSGRRLDFDDLLAGIWTVRMERGRAARAMTVTFVGGRTTELSIDLTDGDAGR